METLAAQASNELLLSFRAIAATFASSIRVNYIFRVQQRLPAALKCQQPQSHSDSANDHACVSVNSGAASLCVRLSCWLILMLYFKAVNADTVIYTVTAVVFILGRNAILTI